MKTKILVGIAIATLVTAGTLTYAASSTGTGNVLNNVFRGMHLTGTGGFNKEFRGMTEGKDKIGGFGMRGFGGVAAMSGLTDTEKTQLATMTNTEKQAFFQAKMTEQKALRDAKEAVIDKLINGEALTDAEKVTLATIKTERATMKVERVAREAQMTEIKPILEKVRAGTTLTTDEQAKLDAFKKTMPQIQGNNKQGNNNKRDGGRGMMGR
ncbi:hypothetical protein GW819_04175 [Candidatus Gracilibacteria bacterium]|nr:hypothetical protein [bacterium]NDK20013.1 hypothetical protein [Candidatus Gracilibacteria bacterium]